MLHVFSDRLDHRLKESQVRASVSQSLQALRTKLAAIAIPEDHAAATQKEIRRAIDESFVSGFRAVMAIGAALAIASALTALTLVGSTPRREDWILFSEFPPF